MPQEEANAEDSGQWAVEARGLGKRFDIYPNDRARFVEFFSDRSRHVEFWALRDVSFRVRRGEAFGVVGSNGAGKSTLLRLLSGVSQPTEGEVIVRAGLSGLLDLGLGFHPDFTGIDNIKLNCSVLGIDDARIRELIPPIVDFAELEDFIDRPVRTYSAGMHLRLAFAIAAHMDYEVIFIDEVLAVGDQYFQRKCIRKIEEFLADGRTLVLVSHDLHSVRSLCSHVAWIHGGRVVSQGATADVVNAYVDVARDREGRQRARLFGGAEAATSKGLEARVKAEARPQATPSWPYFCTTQDPDVRAGVLHALRDVDEPLDPRETVENYEATHGERPVITGTGEARILDVRMLDRHGEPRDEWTTGEPLTIAATWKAIVPIDRPILGVALFRNDDLYIFGPNTRFDGVERLDGVYHGVYTVFVHYPRLPLLTGTYRVSVAVFDKHHLRPHVWHNQLYELRVRCPREDHGVVEIPHHWGLVRHVRGEGEDLP